MTLFLSFSSKPSPLFPCIPENPGRPPATRTIHRATQPHCTSWCQSHRLPLSGPVPSTSWLLIQRKTRLLGGLRRLTTPPVSSGFTLWPRLCAYLFAERLRLLEPAPRALNECDTPMTLSEVKRGLRWGKHRASTPFFRHPMRQRGCFESRLDLLEMPLETFYMVRLRILV
jgi:hypothetical protein